MNAPRINPTTDAAELSVRLAEYNQLKSEQQGRIQHRDGLVYTTLVAMAATITGAIQQHNTVVLLLLPPVAVILGWKYLANDEKVATAGRYLAIELTAHLNRLTGATAVLGWETTHRNGQLGSLRPYLQAATDVLTFCVLPATALVVFWVSGPHPIVLLVVAHSELGLLTGLMWLMVRASLPGKGYRP